MNAKSTRFARPSVHSSRSAFNRINDTLGRKHRPGTHIGCPASLFMPLYQLEFLGYLLAAILAVVVACQFWAVIVAILALFGAGALIFYFL